MSISQSEASLKMATVSRARRSAAVHSSPRHIIRPPSPVNATTWRAHRSPGEPIVFNDQGQNVSATVTMQQVQKGQIRVVLPKAYADADPVFPIPGWSKV